MTIKNFKIYGERCSGTNYIEQLINTNFKINSITKTWTYGSKHFFGFDNLDNSDNTLFIGIIRDPHEWANSLFKKNIHFAKNLRHNKKLFLKNEWYSYNDDASGPNDGTEIMQDRNIYSKLRYKNIFEMRYTKTKFLIEDMPKLVKNYIFIKYEDIINNFQGILNLIKNKFNLIIKENINYPQNILNYKGHTKKKFEKDLDYKISKELFFDSYNQNEEFQKYDKLLNYM